MKNFLGCLIIFVISVTVCDAQCRVIENSTPDGCIYNGTKYNWNETWDTPHCQNCTCTEESVQCCAKYETPMNFDHKCVSIFDDENCVYRVVRKDDPCQECDISLTMS
ncbi:beta-microseminoprotein J1-like [Discoglossus pictus]